MDGIKGLLSLECSKVSRQLLVFNCEQIKIYCFALRSVEMEWLCASIGGGVQRDGQIAWWDGRGRWLATATGLGLENR